MVCCVFVVKNCGLSTRIPGKFDADFDPNLRSTLCITVQVQVTNDFPYIGEPNGLVLSRLGLPQDTLIKIRRKISSGLLRQMSAIMDESTSLSQRSGSAKMPASARVEANQKTLRTESLYSYRMRAESLWGEESQRNASASVSQPGHQHGSVDRSAQRKRWVSDADANSLREDEVPPVAGATGREARKNDTSLTGTYTDIYPVSAAEAIQAGDVLFLSCAQATMIDFQVITVSQKLRGLNFLDVSALDLPGHGTEFFEVVLSDHNQFVGRYPGRDNSEFASYYGCSVVAVRRRGEAEATSGLPANSQSASLVSSQRPSRRVPALDSAEVHLEEGTEGVEPAFTSNTDSPSPEKGGENHNTMRTAASPVHQNANSAPSPTGDAPTAAPTASGIISGLSRSLSSMSILRGNRLKSSGPEEESGVEVAERKFKAGDVILVLAQEEFMEKFSRTKDFFLLTKVGSVPKPVRPFDYLPLLAFLAMLIVVLLDVEMVRQTRYRVERQAALYLRAECWGQFVVRAFRSCPFGVAALVLATVLRGKVHFACECSSSCYCCCVRFQHGVSLRSRGPVLLTASKTISIALGVSVFFSAVLHNCPEYLRGHRSSTHEGHVVAALR